MTSRELREERAVEICRRVSAAIALVAPKGLGRWDLAWELVEVPSVTFLDALCLWTETGSADAREEVKRAGAGVVSAWKDAAAQWESAGRPAGEMARAAV